MSAPSDPAVLKKEAEKRVGTTLRKWRIDRLLDIGGMASVYAATHRNGNRVAIKVLHTHLSEHEEIKDRFLREGYVANKVGHPGAVQVLDDDTTDDGATFLVMELLDGESLDGRLRRTKVLTASEALFAGDHILDVLAAAHDQGIVHRDIKPANVFITRDGRIKVLDFGLARVREASFKVNATREGVLMGTAAYMAPEQAQGKTGQVDPRSDQWAVGALMFTALSGKHVHEGRTMVDRILAAAMQPARSLATVSPHLPASVIALIDRALSYEKDARFPDARAMRKVVQSVFAQLAKHPQAPTPKVDESVHLDPSELESIAVSQVPSMMVPIDVEPPRSVEPHSVEVVGDIPSIAVSMLFDDEPPPKKK